jgi:hypothetical protein
MLCIILVFLVLQDKNTIVNLHTETGLTSVCLADTGHLSVEPEEKKANQGFLRGLENIEAWSTREWFDG